MRVYVLAGIILCSFVQKIYAQGCSDAGFCTMGALKPDQSFNKKIDFKLRSMEISFYRGVTTLTPIVFVATADLNFSLNTKTSFQVKLPYQTVSGTLGTTSGLSDISLCLTRSIIKHEKFDLNLSLGGKIPTNAANKTENDLPLPMYYQTSLGTYDVMTGISFVTSKWLFATGVQHPFNKNNNQFLWQPWIDHSEHSEAYIKKYGRANQLKRGTDVMFRVERNFRFSRINFSAGLLPIWRINSDSFVNAKGESVTEKKTTGLAMSGIITTGYQFNVQSGLRLLIGGKIVQREVNLDGLTRNLVTSISYFYRF